MSGSRNPFDMGDEARAMFGALLAARAVRQSDTTIRIPRGMPTQKKDRRIFDGKARQPGDEWTDIAGRHYRLDERYTLRRVKQK